MIRRTVVAMTLATGWQALLTYSHVDNVAHAAPMEQQCEEYRVTGYVRGAHSPWTADGTSVWTQERIAAASYNVPLGAYVQVLGLGTYRVADRGGGLSARHVDILVDSYGEAYALTGYRTVCVYV